MAAVSSKVASSLTMEQIWSKPEARNSSSAKPRCMMTQWMSGRPNNGSSVAKGTLRVPASAVSLYHEMPMQRLPAARA